MGSSPSKRMKRKEVIQKLDIAQKQDKMAGVISIEDVVNATRNKKTKDNANINMKEEVTDYTIPMSDSVDSQRVNNIPLMQLGTGKLKDPQTLRIFFSSPFGGMEDEREELTKIYLPQIRHLCTLKGLQFVAVDMRWGITSEAADNAQVISICLQELDRSDLFVGFFGQRYGWHGADDKLLQKNFDLAIHRYGWLEDFRDKSVTELEFLHGHLNNPGALPAYICFRDKKYDDAKHDEGVDSKNEELKRKYLAESTHAMNLMEDLKQRVILTHNKCLGTNMAYANPKEGAREMFDAIWRYVTNSLLAETQTQTQRDMELSHHDAFIASRSALYLGGEDYMECLDEFVYKPSATETSGGLLVRGESGSGKSTLLANWIRCHAKRASPIVLLYHFIGCSEASTNVPNILRRLCTELYRHLPNETRTPGDHEHGDDDKNDIINITRQCLANFEAALKKVVESGMEIVVVIDGLNRVDSLGKTAKTLFWIPDNLPRGVRMIVSTLTSDEVSVEHLTSVMKYQALDIQPLSEATQEQFCKRVLKQSGKELSAGQLERVVAVQQTQNPLYLRIFLEELCMFGDFWKLDHRIDELISSHNVRELFEKFLIRLDQDYNDKDGSKNTVEEVLCCMRLANYGLSETELMVICSLPSHKWSPIYFALEKYLVNRAGLLALAFDELISAVDERYMPDAGKRNIYIRKLITYFEERKKADCLVVSGDAMTTAISRPTHELPHLYILLSDWVGLADTLSNIVILKRLHTEGKLYELLEMWKKTGLSGSEIADCYVRSLDEAAGQLKQSDIDAATVKLYTYPGLIDEMLDLGDYLSGREKILLYALSMLDEQDSVSELWEVREMTEYTVGCLYVDMQEFDKAHQYHMRVLDARQKRVDNGTRIASDDDVVQLAISCHGVGILHLKTHEYDKAEEFLLKSKEYHEKVAAGRLSRVVTPVLNLGNVHLSKMNYQQALDYFLQALQMYEELHVHQVHHDIAYIQTNIAVCYRKLYKLDEAEDFYQRSLKNKIKTLGEDHPSVALAYMNLGTLEAYRGNHEQQEKYSQMAVDIYEANETPDTQEQMIFSRENLVNCMIIVGKIEECLPQYWKAFEANLKNGSLSRSLPIIHVKVAGYLISKNLYDDARRIVNEVVQVECLHCDVTMIQMHYLDSLLDPEHRPSRDASLSIDSALTKWPYSMTLLGYKATQDLIPAGDIDSLLTLLRKACEATTGPVSPDMFTTAAGWCNSNDAMLRVFDLALEILPRNKVFLANVIMTLKDEGRIAEAIPHAMELYTASSDEFRYQMLAVETLSLAGKLGVARDLLTEMGHTWINSPECLAKLDKAMETVDEILKETESQ